jgi:hypothetical protein
MSDSKKPKLSELYSLMASSRPLESKEGVNAILYLLELVKRLGKALKFYQHDHNTPTIDCWNVCTCVLCKEAHALLEELEL